MVVARVIMSMAGDGVDDATAPIERGRPYISRDINLFYVQRMYGGSRRSTRPIYGKQCTTTTGECLAESVYMETLKTLLANVKDVVSKFFPNFLGYANIIGEMTTTTALPPPLFTRVFWIKEHPGEKYTNSERQQYDVIDIYIQFSLDWKQDKYLTVSIPDIDSGSSAP